MKKTLAIITTLALIAGSVLSTQAVTQNNEKERGYISISASVDTEIAPDVAELAFAIKTTDTKSMQKAS